MPGRFEVYTDRCGKWRWRLKAVNGHIVAKGANTYSRKGAAVAAVESTQRLLAAGPEVVDVSAGLALLERLRWPCPELRTPAEGGAR